MWWVSHNEHGAFTARGIHGQAIYIDPAAEMVIARFASHPLGANVNLDPTSLPAYHAVAKHLMRVGAVAVDAGGIITAGTDCMPACGYGLQDELRRWSTRD